MPEELKTLLLRDLASLRHEVEQYPDDAALWRALPGPGMGWLMAGGAFYTLGGVFYAWHNLRFHHAVWHLFVLGGSLCHVMAVLGYVVPRAS